MSHEEQISPSSSPLLLAEHESRYRFVRPAVIEAGSWVDISCGTAAGSSRALSDVLPSQVLLTDLNPVVLASAKVNLGDDPRISTRVVDLGSDLDIEGLAGAIDELPAPVVVTCFEVIEHIPTFVPLVGLLRELGRRGVTVVLSAPNDVFSGVQNPFHVTAWGASSMAELLQFLPEERVLATQVSVEGTAIMPEGTVAVPATTPVPLDELPPPLAYIVAFGPLATKLAPVCVSSVTDTLGHRVWEAQRETDNSYFRWAAAEVEVLQLRVHELEAEIERLRARPS